MSDEMDMNAPATRGDLTAMKAEIGAGLKAEFEPVHAQLRRLSVGYAQLQGDVTAIKKDVRELFDVKAELRGLKGTIVALTASVEASMRKWAYQEGMLMDHEGRLKSLEQKPQ